MSTVSQPSLADAIERGLEGQTLDAPAPAACFHCGEPCPDPDLTKDDKAFCCQGCRFVHDLADRERAGAFLRSEPASGRADPAAGEREQWAYLDDPALQQRLLDFTDGKISRVTFQVPAIHCVACVWLLENLFRLHPGIGRSQVNFPAARGGHHVRARSRCSSANWWRCWRPSATSRC